MQCNAVQCSAVQCSAVQCSAVQCSAVQCSAVQCSAVQCSAVQYSTVQYSTVQYSTIQYNTIQYNTIQYNTIKYRYTWPWLFSISTSFTFIGVLSTTITFIFAMFAYFHRIVIVASVVVLVVFRWIRKCHLQSGDCWESIRLHSPPCSPRLTF